MNNIDIYRNTALSRAVASIIVLFVVGIIVTFFVFESPGDRLGAVLWALAYDVIGCGLGFLFGLPRVIQSNSNDDKTPSNVAYAQLANNSLQQITDWLTKMIVGVGLVQLKNVPEYLDRASRLIADPVNQPMKTAQARALILFFLVSGFFGGYILTRCYLARLFAVWESHNGIEDLDTSDRLAIETPVPATDADFHFSQQAVEAAKKLTDIRLTDLSNSREISLWAKARLIEGDKADAVAGFDKALQDQPNDVQLLLEYGIALARQSKYDQAIRKLDLARANLTPYSPLRIKQSIYDWLIYCNLYISPPDGFTHALTYSREYSANNPPTGSILVDTACAYGQKFAWLKSHKGSAAELAETRTAALQVVRDAVKQGNEWRTRLQQLIRHGDPNKSSDDTDLEVFESDEEFREAVGLA
jgi:Tfp pilus assembly protein PilF